MRRALWAVVAVLALVSTACGGGTDEAAGPQAGSTAGSAAVGGAAGLGGTGGSASSCGDGRIDMLAGENCEQSVPHGLTCSGLGMGDGMILCSSTCRLMMMCNDGGGTAGNSGGGTGG